MNDAFFKLPEDKQSLILYIGTKEFAAKPFVEVSTDAITQNCGISKGLLFHYFENKANFYLYCLEKSIQQLTVPTAVHTEGNFYDLLFESLNDKIRLCNTYPNETHLVNMASRETHASVKEGKDLILGKYMLEAKQSSAAIYARVLSKLNLKEPENPKVAEGLILYTSAIISKYLTIYQNSPDGFFENIELIKLELKEYLDLMLEGIVAKQ